MGKPEMEPAPPSEELTKQADDNQGNPMLI